MAKSVYGRLKRSLKKKKKTQQGLGKFSKFGNKGGGPGGSTPSKNYRKKSRGQGR
jgi:hypothetical protein